MRCILFFVPIFFACVAPCLHADESLTPAVLKDLKGATAFIKVDAGALKMSGSGFLIKLSGGVGYVVTNNHVIDTSKPHVIQISPNRQRTITVTGTVRIKAVFFSGTPDELSLPAEVVVADAERDLAILLVKGVNRPIKPIDLNVTANLIETTPIFVFGFPFGEALSVEGHSPAITVGRGTISSIRQNQKGEVVAVQIDGALNPGNSGGPVVDASGRLAGVAVATIVGSGIGLAIPPSQVKQELAGRIGVARIDAARASIGKSVFTARVAVPVIDPMGQIRSVTLYWTVSSAAAALKPESHLSAVPAAHKLLLKIEGAEATGTFEVPAAAGGPTSIVYEASWISGGRVDYSARSDPMDLAQQSVATTPPAPDVPAQGNVPANPPDAAAGSPIPAPAGGDEFISAALTALGSEEGRTQTSGADQLRLAPLDESHRGAVLAALAPHLASSDIGLRVACVRAYVHWATVRELSTLATVAQATQENAASDNAPAAWAAAMVGLVRFDPALAERIFARRKKDFFFVNSTSAEFLKLAEHEPRYAGAAIALLREFDAFHPVVKVSFSQAIQMLQSDAASIRGDGCDALTIAPVDPAQRKRVLALLSPHLNAADGGARTRYVRAYLHWADAANLKDVQAIVAFPETGAMNGHEQAWSAALISIIRLRAAPAAIDGYNSRADNFFFRVGFTGALADLAETTLPEQALAWSFLQQIKDGRKHLAPPDAGGAAPATSSPSPAAPTAKQPVSDKPAPEKPSADVPASPVPASPIPAGALHGAINGQAFVPDRIEMRNGWLIARSGSGFFADKEIKIAFHIRPGEPISGRKYHVEPGDSKKPSLFISQLNAGEKLPKSATVRRYRMDVEFGVLAGDKLSGKITLSSEEQGVELTGSFIANFK